VLLVPVVNAKRICSVPRYGPALRISVVILIPTRI
jgi:hypothetical protein